MFKKVLSLASLLIVIACSPTPPPSDSAITQAIDKSDNFNEHQSILISASKKLIVSGDCTLEDFKEMGGWLESTNKANTSFTYCGGMHISNRIYVNLSTGETFK